MIFGAPENMSVVTGTSGAGRVVNTYKGYRVAGAQAQSMADERVKGEVDLLECVACSKQRPEVSVITCESG